MYKAQYSGLNAFLCEQSIVQSYIKLRPSLTLISAFWNKIFVVNTPLMRLAQRINKYGSAIAVIHSAIVQFLREIGETNTNFISFSFIKILSTNAFVQFHCHSTNIKDVDVWVASFPLTYQSMKWDTFFVLCKQGKAP